MDISLDELNEQHNKVIIHIDVDCFYAQVEEIRDPSLRDKPLGVQQKDYIVTSNFKAREYGVKKMMLLSDAIRLCPELVLVNGEDLSSYRQFSNKMFNLLLTFTPKVEKLGFDENFLDVTDVIEAKLNDQTASNIGVLAVDGHITPEDCTLNSCNCGCETRLILGTNLAKEIRQKLYDELGVTTCAGIAHNKLLAKLIGKRHKPNQQTVLASAFTNELMIGLGSVRSITGIGEKAEILLKEIGVTSVKQLQEISLIDLQRKFNFETAQKYKNWSKGIDTSAVIPSGKPKSIGLEDSCKSISFRADVEEKFRLLLIRLINQVAEDGRIPLVVKITVRKFDSIKKTSHRETKQANITPSLFRELGNGKVVLVEGGQEKLLNIVMRLFERVVNLRLPFNITLLGLAFSKFQERRRVSRSIANYLIKTDLEVQSITSLSSEGIQNENLPKSARSSPMQMDLDTLSETSHASYSSDVSESEIEPSPKKNRITFLLAKRRCFSSNSCSDTASPSKLRVADLRLNSKELDSDTATSPTSSNSEQSICSASAAPAPTSTLPPQCPSTVDPDVFKELPIEVQEELLNQWRTPIESSSTNGAVKTRTNPTTNGKKNTLHRFFIKNK